MRESLGPDREDAGARPLRFVAVGGGTGLPVVLRGLRAALHPDNVRPACPHELDRLVGIVNVVDDGGSSGRLRDAYGVIPPGDARNCLVALATGDPALSAMFQYRFDGEDALAGHSLGNLIITALARLHDDFERAVEESETLLGACGRVIPTTSDRIVLHAEYRDGSIERGESRIPRPGRPIARVWIEPAEAVASPRALDLIAAADVIVLGPGSLYTSVIPTLLVREVAEAITHSAANVVWVANLMTQPGETEGYDMADHLDALRGHVPGLRIDTILMNGRAVAPEVVERYGARRSTPVPPSLPRHAAGDARVVVADVLGEGPKIRHDSNKLASALLALVSEAVSAQR